MIKTILTTPRSILALLSLAPVCILPGCASSAQKNGVGLFAKLAAMDVSAADVSQTTNTPVYSHGESVSGLSWGPDGLTATNVKAFIAIPLWGTTWNFSATSVVATKAAVVAMPAIMAAAPAATH